MSVIELSNVKKAYGNNVILSDFNLNIEAGDFIAITGGSGSGKSTLLNILGLIEGFNVGTYKIFEFTNPKIETKEGIFLLRNKISYLFQNFALINTKTVKENLNIALQFQKISSKEKERRIGSALDEVGLRGFENKKIYQLSGGEQQRVALSRILLKPSEIILADEPTGSLDCQNRDKIMKILMNLNEKGKTIIIVSHDPYVVKCAKRVVSL